MSRSHHVTLLPVHGALHESGALSGLFVALLLCSVTFLQISLQAMKSTEDDVILQGIEFWSNVCEEEIALAAEAEEV